MIVLDVVQGSEEWLQARLGIPTASQFHRIITPKTMRLSSASDSYLDELLAEWAMGRPLDLDETRWMERGSDLEREAVGFYEIARDTDTTEAGLVLTDDGKIGCSPDRLVGEDGGLEVKCPKPATHMAYLRGSGIDKYCCQIQGALYVTGRAWWDFLSWNPELPPALVRFKRDEEFIAALDEALRLFVEKLDAAKARIGPRCGMETR